MEQQDKAQQEKPHRERVPGQTGTRLRILASIVLFAIVIAAVVYVPRLLAPTGAPVVVSTVDPQAASKASLAPATLVAKEDQRLLGALRAIPFAVPAYIDTKSGAPTAVLTARPAPYTLDDLILLGAARRADAGTVDLVQSVLVGPYAKLDITAPDTTLRLASSAAGFTSLVAWKGSMVLAGAPGAPLTVTSWDPVRKAVDSTTDDGRAYVRVVDGDLQSNSVAITDLGFWSGRTGGLALTGSVSVPSTGAITDTVVRGGHYGLYSSDTSKLTITGSSFIGNEQDGVLLHRNSAGPTITGSIASDNGGNGFVANRGSSGVSILDSQADSNAVNGVMLIGRPLAEKVGPSGYSLAGQGGFQVDKLVTRSNAGDGILAWDADDLVVTRSTADRNNEGIIVRGATSEARVIGNTVFRSVGVGIGVRDGARETLVLNNDVVGASNGIQVRDSIADITGNSVTQAGLHGLSFRGAVSGSTSDSNTLAGKGASALDVARLDAGALVTLTNNNVADWDVKTSPLEQIRKLISGDPLLVVWSALLLLVLFAVIARGRARRRPSKGLSPYPVQEASVAGLISSTAASAAPVVLDGDSRSSTRLSLVG